MTSKGAARIAFLGLVSATACTSLPSMAPSTSGAGGGAGRVGSGGAGGIAVASGGAGGYAGTPGLGSGGVIGGGTGGVGGGIPIGSGGIGSGGIAAVGGTVATGGKGGMGGGAAAGGSPGAATGGSGTGGAPVSCQNNTTQCLGNGMQTCTNGQWSATVACGAHQTCGGPVGTAACACNVDAACSAVGNFCPAATTLAVCARDPNGCLFATTSTCANGACSGAAGAAACCVNACTGTTAQCLSSVTMQTCGLVSTGCTAFTSTACGAGLVCERFSPAACADPNWAEWPVPNCAPDVATGAPHAQGYTDNGDGTVADLVTGLIWQQGFSAVTSQTEAITYCQTTLRAGGHNDWRLPSLIELVSLVDLGVTGPSVNPAFAGTPSVFFWSSTQVTGASPAEAWLQNFGDGGTGRSTLTTNGYDVRCVR